MWANTGIGADLSRWIDNGAGMDTLSRVGGSFEQLEKAGQSQAWPRHQHEIGYVYRPQLGGDYSICHLLLF